MCRIFSARAETASQIPGDTPVLWRICGMVAGRITSFISFRIMLSLYLFLVSRIGAARMTVVLPLFAEFISLVPLKISSSEWLVCTPHAGSWNRQPAGIFGARVVSGKFLSVTTDPADFIGNENLSRGPIGVRNV